MSSALGLIDIKPDRKEYLCSLWGMAIQDHGRGGKAATPINLGVETGYARDQPCDLGRGHVVPVNLKAEIDHMANQSNVIELQ